MTSILMLIRRNGPWSWWTISWTRVKSDHWFTIRSPSGLCSFRTSARVRKASLMFIPGRPVSLYPTWPMSSFSRPMCRLRRAWAKLFRIEYSASSCLETARQKSHGDSSSRIWRLMLTKWILRRRR